MVDRRILYSIAAFVATAGLYLAITASGASLPQVPSLYYYGLEDWGNGKAVSLAGVVLAYLFVSVAALLFFGHAAPLAMAMEGLKYASAYSHASVHPYDFLFVIPQFIAVYAGLRLSANAEADFDHRGTVFKQWQFPLLLYVAGAALALVLYLVRPPFVS